MCSGVASRKVAMQALKVCTVVTNVIAENRKVQSGSHHQASGHTMMKPAAIVTPTEFSKSPSTWRYAA